MPLAGPAWIAVIAAAVLAASPSTPAPPKIAVLEFELNDLTPTPNTPDEIAAIALASRLLRHSLATDCGYDVVPVDSVAQHQANSGLGYLFAHPTESAHLANAAGADWVVVGQLTVSSPIVSEFHVELVRVDRATLASAVSIEVKGDPGDSALFATGIAHVARQIDRSFGPAPRCPVSAK
jgi:Protein of unknown function (DUF2380)